MSRRHSSFFELLHMRLMIEERCQSAVGGLRVAINPFREMAEEYTCE